MEISGEGLVLGAGIYTERQFDEKIRKILSYILNGKKILSYLLNGNKK
jgi:hypothetical protein